METSKRNLCRYLKQAKMSFYFSFIPSQNRKADQVLFGSVDTSVMGEEMEKGCGRVNIMQILRIHVCKWKMIPVKTTLGMVGRWNKGE
jgi:hypothetical protein